jgi:serine-type D-Ala-D-Ala carboxypeptidase/endopeptidase (penicillin-binding protein 4)
MDGGSARSQPSTAEPAGEGDPETAGEPGAGSAASAAGRIVAPADPATRAAWLGSRIDAAIAGRPSLGAAKIAVHVVDLGTKAAIASRQPDRTLNLASNTKVLTAAAALRALGSGFRWRTSVFGAPPDASGTVKGDLYLRGRGDPVLSVEGMRQLALEVAARGVRSVEGKLVLDTGYFDAVTTPPHFDEQPEERAAFRAPVASLGVARSAFTVVVLPRPDGTARVTIEPPLPNYLKLVREQVTSIPTGRTRLRLDIKPKPDAIELELTGQVRRGLGTWDLRRRVDDPARYAAEVFQRALADQGVKLRSRAIGSGPVPVNLKQIAAHDSATLGDVVRLMNKHSDNNIAETVLKTLGAERRTTPGPATWADGIAALRAELGKLGVTGDFRVENGSGLFGSTQVSARQLVAVLAGAHADYRIGPDLVASLPVAGHDGTLSRRFLGKPARGRVRAKTGTLDRVLTLAGYAGVDGGRLLAFAILVNDIPAGQRPTARVVIDEIVDSLAAYLDAT